MLRAWTTDGDGEAVVVKAFNDTVLKKSLMTLREGVWLGDEVNLQGVEAASTACKFSSKPETVSKSHQGFLQDSVVERFHHNSLVLSVGRPRPKHPLSKVT